MTVSGDATGGGGVDDCARTTVVVRLESVSASNRLRTDNFDMEDSFERGAALEGD